MTVDQRYLNVETGLGMGLEPPKYAELFAAYADSQPVYTRAEIIDRIRAGGGSLAKFCHAILNQTRHPWCWAFGPTSCLMIYALIHKNLRLLLDPAVGPLVTGVRGGNSIDAMIVEVQSVYGQPLASVTGNDPIAGNVDPGFSAEWKADAAKRKCHPEMWPRYHSPEDAASSLLNGHPGNIGTNAFGPHDVCLAEVGLAGDGKTLLFAGPNSWGQNTSYRLAYPGRPGWWQATEHTISDAFSSRGFGGYGLVGAQIADDPAPPA